jgi:hypothetical protein
VLLPNAITTTVRITSAPICTQKLLVRPSLFVICVSMIAITSSPVDSGGKRRPGTDQQSQSSSASRLTAGAAGFLIFSQFGDRPWCCRKPLTGALKPTKERRGQDYGAAHLRAFPVIWLPRRSNARARPPERFNLIHVMSGVRRRH